MRDLNYELRDRIINYRELEEYGFKKENNFYTYKTAIYNK